MKNGEQSIHPTEGHVDYNNDPNKIIGGGIGLTKREHFAAMAMQGLNSSFANTQQHPPNLENVEYITMMAVTQADALLKELDK